MRVGSSLVLCAAVAFVSVGCEHEHERDSGRVEVRDRYVGEESHGAVIDGGVVIDSEPDPAQRVYVYDEGYPPGTYVYNNYYYYGGHRYPRDVFVNRYVEENRRQHRYTDTADNRRQGQQFEQRQRADFSQNHGARQNGAGRSEAPAHYEQSPSRQPEAARPNVERQQNQIQPNEEHRAAIQQPENRPPVKEEHRATVPQPENRTSGNQEHRENVGRSENKENREKEQRKPNSPEERREEAK